MQLSSQYLLILLSPLVFRATASPASLVALTSSPNSILNNTILGAVVPSSFTIRPGSPGARLGPSQALAKTQVLFQVLQALQNLALEDFNAESLPRAYDHPWFEIDIDGPTLEPKSNILYRYALQGLYSAVWYMLSNNFYRALTYELLWEGSLVGWIRFIKKDGSTLGSNDSMNTDINSLLTAPPNTNSTLLGVATNVTGSSALSTIFHNGRVTVEIDMTGRGFLTTDVFMTTFTAILEMAPYPKTEIVRAFGASGDYNIWFQIDDPATPPRRRAPFLTYEVVIWAVGRVPVAMTKDGNNWREVLMTIKIDNRLVGRGSMAADSSAPLVLASPSRLNVTTT